MPYLLQCIFKSVATYLQKERLQDTIAHVDRRLFSFMQVDAPVSPGSKGSTVFMRGISDWLRQRYREQLFNVGRKDLIDVAKRWDLDAV